MTMEYYNIAGLNLCVNGVDYEYFKDRLSEYSTDKNEKADMTVNFEMDTDAGQGLPDFFAKKLCRHYFETDDNFGFYDYYDDIDKTAVVMQADREWKKYTYIYNDINALFNIPNEIAVTNALGHMFKDCILHYDGLVIHSSTIVYNGRAVTFTAPSGTGKSTHTQLWKQYYPDVEIINDDTPALRLIGDDFYAFGTPWSGKTHINKNMSAPLCTMVFIERADECSINEITPMEAFTRMMRELPISPFKEQSDLMMSVMNKLFSKVPAYLLKCDISKDAVEVVKNKLF